MIAKKIAQALQQQGNFYAEGNYLKNKSDPRWLTSFGDEESAVVFDNGEDTLKVVRGATNGLYGLADKWDRSFVGIEDLARFLNLKGYRFVGIDDIV